MKEVVKDLKNWYLRNFVAHSHFKMPSSVIPDEHDKNRYIFGATSPLKKEILKADGNYLDVANEIIKKLQNQFGLETMGCTGDALLNNLAMQAKLRFNEDWNKSFRYTNKMAGTTTQGNSMVKQMDTLRKVAGCVDEKDWPWTSDINTWAEYYSSIPAAVIAKGQEWMRQYTINYEAVPMNKQAIAEALKYSPLYVSGYAWAQRNGIFQSWGRANHCFNGLIVAMDGDGCYYVVDQYEPFIKKLSSDYLFGAIYTVILSKNNQYNLDYIASQMKRGFQYVLLTQPFKDYAPGVYKLTAGGITQDGVIKDINDAGVKSLAAQGILTGINANDFSKMIVTQ